MSWMLVISQVTYSTDGEYFSNKSN